LNEDGHVTEAEEEETECRLHRISPLASEAAIPLRVTEQIGIKIDPSS
jgi:hypothetical protein